MQRIKNPLTFIFITVLIDCIGIRIVYPVAATLISEVGHMDVNKAVTYSGWMMAAYAIMQFIFSPILGSLSDTFGRRPILLISLLGLGVNYIFLAIANTLTLLFIGRIIAGICGSSLTTAYAYVADKSPLEKRAQHFGVLGAAFGLGFIIGPFLGGVLSEWGTRVPFVAAAILSFLNFLYGFFILPESLPAESRRSFSFKRANPIGAFLKFRNHENAKPLLLSLFFLFLGVQVMPAIWPFYTKYVFHWSDLSIGYSLAFVGVMVAGVKSFLIKQAQLRLGEKKSVITGFVFYFVGMLVFSIANEAWMLYVILLFYCLGGIASPTLQAILCTKIPANEQGELQGVISSIMSLCNILSPLLMSNLFYFFTKQNTPIYFPGAPFLAAAVSILIAILFFIFSFKSNFSIFENKQVNKYGRHFQ
ncbi:MAG: TCR/Tet family MFS transporter [Bacteroidetes bacterium]|nr:TCR/Tet family MFS transporter [Bacteroidota bacterium]